MITRRALLTATALAPAVTLLRPPPATAVDAVPASYDFNEHYPALPVLQQAGTDVSCVTETWAGLLNASRRMWDGAASHYDGSQITVASGYDTALRADTYEVTAPDRIVTLIDGDPDGTYWPSRGGMTPAAVQAALWRNGVAFLTLPSGPLQGVGPTPQLPTLTGGAPALLDHAGLAVGYTPDGVIFQNAWGRTFGAQGRALLTWGFLTAYSVQVKVFVASPHAVDSLVIPARRVPAIFRGFHSPAVVQDDNGPTFTFPRRRRRHRRRRRDSRRP